MRNATVLIRPHSPYIHTSLHCATKGGHPADEFTVTTRERAVARGLRPCPGECAGTAWYWWVEGESLLGGSE